MNIALCSCDLSPIYQGNIAWIGERQNNKSARYQDILRNTSPRYCSSETLLQRYVAKQNDISPRYIVAAMSVVTMQCMPKWTFLQRFILVKRLCMMNPCLCSCNGHSRVIRGWTKTKKLSMLQRLMGLKTSVLKNVLRSTQWTVHSRKNLSASFHSRWPGPQHVTI